MRKPTPITPDVNPNALNKPIPGWSLTQSPKKWNWEQPPRRTNVGEVVDYVTERLDRPEVQKRYLKLMVAGVSIEEIVESISMAGFMQGEYSPDVAEMIKGPLGFYLLAIAAENDVPAKMFAQQDPQGIDDEGVDDATLLELMRARNPEFYRFLQERNNRQYDMVRGRREKITSGIIGRTISEEPEEEMVQEDMFAEEEVPMMSEEEMAMMSEEMMEEEGPEMEEETLEEEMVEEEPLEEGEEEE